MDLAEFERAKTLLTKSQCAELDEIQIGKWVATNEDGVAGLYTRKTAAIEALLNRHLQSKDRSKTYRNGQGTYLLCILDPEEDPEDEIYLTFRISRITQKNLFRFQELAISSMLPEWYFNPYTTEYKSWNQS